MTRGENYWWQIPVAIATFMLIYGLLMLFTYGLRKGATPEESRRKNAPWAPIFGALSLMLTVAILMVAYGKWHLPDWSGFGWHGSATPRAANLPSFPHIRQASIAAGFPWTWMSLILVVALVAFVFIKTWIGRVVTTLVTYGVIILMTWHFSHPDKEIYVWQLLTAVIGLALMYLAAKPRKWLFDLDEKTGDHGPAKMHWPSLIGCWIFFVGAMLFWQNGFTGLALMLFGWLLGGVLSVPLLQIMVPTIFGRPMTTGITSIKKGLSINRDEENLMIIPKKMGWWGWFVFAPGHRGHGTTEGMLWFKNGFGVLLLPLWLPLVGIITLVQNRVEMTDFTDEVPTAGMHKETDKAATTSSMTPNLARAPIKYRVWIVAFSNDDPEVVLKLSPPDRDQVKKMCISGVSAWFATKAITLSFETAMTKEFFKDTPKKNEIINPDSDLGQVQALVLVNVGHRITQVKILDRNPPQAVQDALAETTRMEAQRAQAEIKVEIEKLSGEAIQARVAAVAEKLNITPAEAWAFIIREEQAKHASHVILPENLPSLASILGKKD